MSKRKQNAPAIVPQSIYRSHLQGVSRQAGRTSLARIAAHAMWIEAGKTSFQLRIKNDELRIFDGLFGWAVLF